MKVPRVGRVLDLVGLLLFLSGGATFAWSWLGFREVQTSSDALAGSAVAIANRYWLIQKVGVGIMLAGIAVFVLAWWVARRPAAQADG